LDTTTPKSVEVVCPAGKVVLGGGFTLYGPSGFEVVENHARADDRWGVTVNRTGSAATWGVSVSATCASITP
jgi:hypothetical protein